MTSYCLQVKRKNTDTFSSQQGNRSSSSACGSADVLEALGVVFDLDPEVSDNQVSDKI